MGIDAGRAYSRRAVEYANLFGSMAAVHPSDRQLVDTWADALTGPVIDAGSGPGQWTNYLVQRGTVASGVDLSLDFIAHARAQYPGISFEVGDIDALGIRTGALGGLLSWYSLIHHEPRFIHIPLTEFARVLRPGGGLLLGFFEGSGIEKFDHAVLDAYKWPVAGGRAEPGTLRGWL
jgi:SAM-dependent methyltransferase